MHPDHLLQSDFPNYGHCSIGQLAEETKLVPLKARQLTKKILKTSQGSMAGFVCGTYAGRHPHQKYKVTHPRWSSTSLWQTWDCKRTPQYFGGTSDNDYKFYFWFRNLGLEETTLALIDKKNTAVGKWWAAQPDDTTLSISRMAQCFGIPGARITSRTNILCKYWRWQLPWPLGWAVNWKPRRICPALFPPSLCANTRLGLWLHFLLQHSLRVSTSSLHIGSFRHAWWCSMSCIIQMAMTNWKQYFEALHAQDTSTALHSWHTQQFSRSFFEPNSVYFRFTCIAKHQPLFYIGSTDDHTLGREHTRYRKFKQVNSGQFVLSELAIRFWSHSNNFFWWWPVPIYIRRANHCALEHALIQLWQPKLNYPFISQFFIPRKGIISKIPYSNTRQFGIASLWRKKRHKTTGKALRSVLCSPLFQSRVRMWTLLQDLGSNTRRRFEETQYIRSTAFSLEGCYALRRLGLHLPETHQKMALQAIDSAIRFRRGKPVGRVRPFRAPWMLSRQLDSHIRQILRLWYFGM